MNKIESTAFVIPLKKEDVQFVIDSGVMLEEVRAIRNKFIETGKVNKKEAILIASSFVEKTDKILADIEPRIAYILSKIGQITQADIVSWSYDNEGIGSQIGYFDAETYSDYIGFESDREEVIYKGVRFDNYESYIPISFLWEDFEEQVKQEFNEFKLKVEEESIKDELLVKNKELETARIINAIQSKLTNEELQYVTFVKV